MTRPTDRNAALAAARALVETSLALLDAHQLGGGATVHLALGLHHLAREAERLQTDGADVSTN